MAALRMCRGGHWNQGAERMEEKNGYRSKTQYFLPHVSSSNGGDGD